ncbi:hypothetical protein [Rhodonellum sp.]|uniref:hypothetical protein n=1 Tax=Rhodonellum sp. TaxID=2231180 RepID=UPI00271F42C8|nr:hypothetical protein [Rhodonellum sp.]MDO9552405.1 hypothetical protein [Rhodonellum sp.]
MKLFVALLIAFGVSGSVIAKTQDSDESTKATVSLRKVDANKVQLLYGSVPDGTVMVKIFDETKTLVQKDRILNKVAFSKYYDFSNIKPGKYLVAVYDNSGEVDHLDLDLTKEANAPVVYSKIEKMEGNKYKVLVNALLASNISLFIYEGDQLIHEEKLENSTGFQKLYSFKNTKVGSKLEFFVKTDNGFSEMIAVR